MMTQCVNLKVLNPLRECRFSTLSTIIPNWTDVPIWNVGFPMKNIDIVSICVISLYTLCHHFRFHSIFRTVNASYNIVALTTAQYDLTYV